MNPVTSRLRLYLSYVSQQFQERITQEIVPVSPDLRRHAAQRTAALARVINRETADERAVDSLVAKSRAPTGLHGAPVGG
jgi:F0F1-type ATP synthase membrane subunit b/b'